MTRVRLAALAATLLAACSPSYAPSTTLCTLPYCELEPQAYAATVSGSKIDLDIGSLAIDPDGRFQIVIPTPFTIKGTVHFMDGSAVAGTVLATRKSRILGQPDRAYQTPIDGATGGYSILASPLGPNEQYTVRVVFADTSQLPSQAYPINAGDSGSLDFKLAAPESLPLVTGRITDPLGAGIPGMSVQILDRVSGDVVSTTNVTDSDGRYAVRLSGMAKSSLRLTAKPTSQVKTLTPSLEIQLSATPDANNQIAADVAAPPLPSAVNFNYRVIGVSSNGATKPVGGATCEFIATVSDTQSNSPVVAVYRALTESDADGVVSAMLVPSTTGVRHYQVTITPPASSPFSGYQAGVDVGPSFTANGYGPEIVLPLRPQLSGRVVTARGPVKGVTILPAVSSLVDVAAGNGAAARLAQAVTDADGRFNVGLDAGTYDIGLYPLVSMQLPRRWLTSTHLDADLTLADDIVLPAGAKVQARILDSDLQPIGDATVVVYAVPPSNQLCVANVADCLVAPRAVAEGATGADGTASLVLPAVGNVH